jgi:AraC-like DNA-binding protein
MTALSGKSWLDGRQRIEPHHLLPWHTHSSGYAALLLGGSYLEAGDGGRRRAQAGHLIVHAPFSGHSDRMGAHGADIVNLPLGVGAALSLKSGIVDDPEAVLREVRNAPEATERILAQHVRPAPREAELADLLAGALDQSPGLVIRTWAEAHHVSMRTLDRQFAKLYGITPAHYRWRARALAAWRAISRGEDSLTGIAHAHYFADQSHMSRSIKALTGFSPRRWQQFFRMSI